MEKRIVYSVPGMENIPVRKDLTYKNADGQTLTADVYLPAEDKRTPNPVVILIHGGVPPGVHPKDWGVFVSWGQLIGASGMAAVTFNHRLLWNNGFDAASLAAATQDLSDLLGFLRDTAASLSIDASRVGLMAFSAGAPLLTETITKPTDPVRCLVGFYPYLGPPLTSPNEAPRFSALDSLRLAGKLPPMFVAKAGRDQPTLNASIDAFVDQAKTRDVDVRLIEHPEGVHGFDIWNDDDTSREIIRQAVQFMRKYLSH
jgi:acetyl esterase/lipase